MATITRGIIAPKKASVKVTVPAATALSTPLPIQRNAQTPRKSDHLKASVIGAAVLRFDGFLVSLTGDQQYRHRIKLNTKRRSPDSMSVEQWVLKTFPKSKRDGSQMVLDSPPVIHGGRRFAPSSPAIQINVFRGSRIAKPDTTLANVRASYPKDLSALIGQLDTTLIDTNNELNEAAAKFGTLEQLRDDLIEKNTKLAAAKRDLESQLELVKGKVKNQDTKIVDFINDLMSKYTVHPRVASACDDERQKKETTLESFVEFCFRLWCSAEGQNDIHLKRIDDLL